MMKKLYILIVCVALLHAGIWHDGGRAAAGDVLSFRQGTVRDKIRGVRDRGEERRDEDCGPGHRRIVASQPGWRDLYSRQSDNERYNFEISLDSPTTPFFLQFVPVTITAICQSYDRRLVNLPGRTVVSPCSNTKRVLSYVRMDLR